MRFLLSDGQTVLIDRPFTFNSVHYPANWLRSMTPEERVEFFGAVEQPEPEAPVTPYVPTPLDAIRNLEATVTPRRLREAVLTDAGKTWLDNLEAQIAAERAKL